MFITCLRSSGLIFAIATCSENLYERENQVEAIPVSALSELRDIDDATWHAGHPRKPVPTTKLTEICIELTLFWV
jgi:hypothetical protein